MTAETGSHYEPLAIPEALAQEINRSVDKLLGLRAANRTAYSVTTEAQFGEAVGVDIASQRVYLEHQVKHADVRLRAFESEEREALPDLSTLSREELLALYDTGTAGLERVFRNPANWGRRVDIPYSEPGLSGFSVLQDMRAHEAHHEGQNRGTLAHFGIPQPTAVTATFGK